MKLVSLKPRTHIADLSGQQEVIVSTLQKIDAVGRHAKPIREVVAAAARRLGRTRAEAAHIVRAHLRKLRDEGLVTIKAA